MKKDHNKRQAERFYSIKPTRIALKGKEYRLNDISQEGLGVIVDDPHTFFLGQRFDAIPLQLDSDTFSVAGVVAHITKSESDYICGIRFSFAGIQEYKTVAQFKKEKAL